MYFPKVEGLTGFKVTVSPKLIVVLPGRTATYKVTIQHNGAPLDQYSFGKLHWRSDQHQVTSALAIRPLTVKSPTQVSGSGTSGSVQVPLTSGYSGTLTTGVTGVKHVRFSTFDADYPANTDLDVFVYRAGTTTLLARSAGGVRAAGMLSTTGTGAVVTPCDGGNNWRGMG